MGDFSPVPGSRAGGNLNLFLFAGGNTTGASSSSTMNAKAISFSAAGGLSIGMSGSSIVISGAASGVATSTGNIFAVGATTGLGSSTINTFTSQNFSGAGGISVGFSSSTMIISAPLNTISYFEPMPLYNTLVSSLPNGATMLLAPFVLQAPLALNQIQLLGSFTLSVMAKATSIASYSASASMASMMTAVIYSQMGGTSSQSYSSLSSTILTYSVSQTLSGSSTNYTNGISFSYPAGIATGTSSSVVSATSTTTTINSSTSAFSLLRVIPLHFTGTLLPGSYVLGVQGTTASGGASAMSWSGSIAGNTILTNALGSMGSAFTGPFFPGIGSASTTATSVIPTSFNATSISSMASAWRMWMQLVNASL